MATPSPTPSTPTWFLIDHRSATERRVITSWIAEHAPHGRIVNIGDQRALAAALAEADHAAVDPLLQPVGVVWLPPKRTGGERRFAIRDTLTPGDPRHPPAWRQGRLLAADPQRATVIAGDAAPLSEVDQRWTAAAGGDADRQRRAGFIARQARLAVQREETRRFGAHHKVPLEVRTEIVEQQRFEDGLHWLAGKTGETLDALRSQAEAYLDEMVASLSRHSVDITAEVSRLYHRSGMRGKVHTDPTQMEMVTTTAASHPTVFLSNHRSYLDSTVLAVVLRDHGLPPNHRLGGANMSFGVFGKIGRRNGIIYIRRSFRDNEVYKWVLREYLGYLASKRFSLEWNIEGTRSRTGKLGPPKLGLLSYIVDAYLDGRCADYQLLPVAIVYDELIDVEEFARYAKGGTKKAESLGSFVTYIRRNREFYGLGDMHVRFGAPVSLRAELGPPPSEQPGDSDAPRPDVQPIANLVAVRINDATPITPPALICLVLLGTERALTMTELRMALDYLIGDVRRADVPMTDPTALESTAGIDRAMAPLLRHGAMSRFVGGQDEVYAITDDQRLVASYYRNTLLHHFVDAAIAQVALHRLTTAELGEQDPVEFVAETAARLRHLFRHDMFFPEEGESRRRHEAAISRQQRTWRARLRAKPAEQAATLLREWRPLTAPVILRSMVDAYLIVAATVAASPSAPEETLVERCLGHGRQLLLQGRIRGADSVSALLIESGVKVVGDPAESADALVTELSELGRSLDHIRRLAEAQFDGTSPG